MGQGEGFNPEVTCMNVEEQIWDKAPFYLKQESRYAKFSTLDTVPEKDSRSSEDQFSGENSARKLETSLAWVYECDKLKITKTRYTL